MPRIPEALIDQVRQSIDIVDVISEHVALTRRGKNFLGLCPFHDDASPSMNVSQDKQIYKCFACGAGGNAFTFLRDIEHISFIEAVRKLADRAGIALPDANDDRIPQESFDELYRAGDLALKYYHHMLMEHDSGAIARNYLEGRGITRETIAAFSLGYALDRWDGFLQAATRRGFSPQVLERAGLVSPRQGGSGFYDRFRNRVMFPILASTGRPVAFGARALSPDEQAKYLNSPETPIYNKSAILYGLWQGRDAIRNADQALVVEGYMDLVALSQYGIPNAVASSGTALTADHARLLRRYASRIVLVFDGDAAGTGAAVRGIGSLFEIGLDARVVSLPEGHDPDSFVRERGADAFRDLIASAAPAVDFLMNQLARREDLSTIDGKTRAAHDLADLIGRVKDQALRQFLIQDIAQKLRLDESAFIQIAQASRRPPRRSPAEQEPAPAPFNPHPIKERELIYFMMQNEATADRVLKFIPFEDFSNSAYRRIAHIIAQNRKQGQPVDAAFLVDQLEDPNLAHILSEISLKSNIPETATEPNDDYIRDFRLKNIARQLGDLYTQIRNNPDPETLKILQAQHHALTAQRRALAASSS